MEQYRAQNVALLEQVSTKGQAIGLLEASVANLTQQVNTYEQLKSNQETELWVLKKEARDWEKLYIRQTRRTKNTAIAGGIGMAALTFLLILK